MKNTKLSGGIIRRFILQTTAVLLIAAFLHPALSYCAVPEIKNRASMVLYASSETSSKDAASEKKKEASGDTSTEKKDTTKDTSTKKKDTSKNTSTEKKKDTTKDTSTEKKKDTTKDTSTEKKKDTSKDTSTEKKDTTKDTSTEKKKDTTKDTSTEKKKDTTKDTSTEKKKDTTKDTSTGKKKDTSKDDSTGKDKLTGESTASTASTAALPAEVAEAEPPAETSEAAIPAEPGEEQAEENASGDSGKESAAESGQASVTEEAGAADTNTEPAAGEGQKEAGSDEGASDSQPHVTTELEKGREYLSYLDERTAAEMKVRVDEARAAYQLEKKKRAYAVERDAYRKEISGDKVWSGFKDYVFLGDSRVVGFNVYGFLDSDRVLADAGDTILAIDDRIDSIKELSPRYIFISYGINDVNLGLWPSADEYTRDFGAKIDDLRKNFPEAEIYVNSILPATDEAVEQHPLWGNLPEYSDAVRQMCEQKEVCFIDNTSIVEEHMDLYAMDGVHIDPDFYHYWAENQLLGIYDLEHGFLSF